MLKKNEWYFLPKQNLDENNVIGRLCKVLDYTNGNPNYVNTEQWTITKERKFKHIGVLEQADGVYIEKFGKKVKAPSKSFQFLYSDTVKQKLDNVKSLDDEDEYN